MRPPQIPVAPSAATPSTSASIPPRSTFTPVGDHYRGTLEFVTLVYDLTGNSVIVAGNPVYANFNRQEYEKISHVGIPYHQEVSVPAKGDYYLRIIVHDLPTDHVGSIKVPLSAVSKLPPSQSALAAHAK